MERKNDVGGLEPNMQILRKINVRQVILKKQLSRGYRTSGKLIKRVL